MTLKKLKKNSPENGVIPSEVQRPTVEKDSQQIMQETISALRDTGTFRYYLLNILKEIEKSQRESIDKIGKILIKVGIAIEGEESEEDSKEEPEGDSEEENSEGEDATK